MTLEKGLLTYISHQLYHQAKMCACTDIFAKPSRAQPHEMREGNAQVLV